MRKTRGVEQLVVVFLGVTASGKSFLAKAWAQKHHFPYLNTDVIRKRLARMEPWESCPEGVERGIYTASFTQRTYDALLSLVLESLQAPNVSCVVVDGTFQKRTHRDLFLAGIGKSAALVFVLCTCQEEVVRYRLTLRAADSAAVSDGRWEIYLHQKEVFEDPEELSAGQLQRIDTNTNIETLLEALDQLL